MTRQKDATADLHPWVRRTWRGLEVSKHEYHGLIRPEGDQILNVQVGRESIKRSMLIWDQLLKSVDAQGCKFRSEDKYPFRTIVTVEGEPLSIVLREKTCRRERVPTAEERARMDRYPHLSSVTEWEYRPSGKLLLTIDFVNCYNQSVNEVSWADGEKKRLEERLDSFVDVLSKVVREIKRKRAWCEQEARERQEQDRHRQETICREAEETKLREELEQQAKSFETACSLRRFVASVRDEAIARRGGIERESSIGKWIEWASRHADRIDPVQVVMARNASPNCSSPS